MNLFVLVFGMVGLIFFVTGIIQRNYPAKKINHLYGYRTKKSMKNQQIWEYAQTYAAQQMIKMGGIIMLLGCLIWIFDYQSSNAVWIVLGVIIFFLLIMVLVIENTLKNKFPDL